jgi:CRISPR-associated protein Cas5t
MITLEIEVPFATCRKSFARSFAETYPVPPPATVYGLLLALVGERFRKRHEGVRLGFGYRRLPQVATTLRKLSRYKYGVASKQSKLGNAPDYIESLCGIDILCCLDSSRELRKLEGEGENRTLEARVSEAILFPDHVDRYGVLCLGLSDDAVNDVRLCERLEGQWYGLHPCNDGEIELPTWVDHVGGIATTFQRYRLDSVAIKMSGELPVSDFTQILAAPRA